MPSIDVSTVAAHAETSTMKALDNAMTGADLTSEWEYEYSFYSISPNASGVMQCAFDKYDH